MVVREGGGVGGVRGEGPAARSGTAIAQVNTFRREGLNTWFVEIRYGELPLAEDVCERFAYFTFKYLYQISFLTEWIEQ